jgi:hypothetical protein
VLEIWIWIFSVGTGSSPMPFGLKNDLISNFDVNKCYRYKNACVLILLISKKFPVKG